MDKASKYNALIEELRRRYKIKYGQTIDDDLLIMIIRMNEMEVSLNQQIKQIQQPILKSKLELLFFTLGKRISIITLVIMLINLIILIVQIIKVS